MSTNDLIVLSKNSQLVLESGYKDFAQPGLYSIILEQQGNLKTRLFVFDNDERSLNKVLVPIHNHKYIDEFHYLFGDVVDYCYNLDDRDGLICKAFKFSRLSDKEQNPIQDLQFNKVLNLRTTFVNETHIIDHLDYHTVCIREPETAWVIRELKENDLYDKSQTCYILPSMNLENFSTTKMTEQDYLKVESILNKNGYSLGLSK